MTAHPFRFGAVTTPGPDWREQARRAEEFGFDTLLMPDRPQLPSPLPVLAACAAVTERLGVGPYVLAATLHEPEAVARDCRALFNLWGARFQPGIGAGLDPAPPGGRLARLREMAAAVRGAIPEARRLVAVSGPRGMKLAGAFADTIAVGIPVTSQDSIADQVQRLRDGAGDRLDEIEWNMNLAAVGDAPTPYQVSLTAAQLRAADSPAAVWGDADHMADQLQRRRERLGVSYWSAPISFAADLAPVIARLRGR
ncbi:MAG: LLM class flavin-dependent oxidoreductase [Candidatus Dormibacteraceae bacterium]